LGTVAAKSSGVVLFSDKGLKFKVYANGSLQNANYMSEVRICCFPDEKLTVKVEFEDNTNLEGTIFFFFFYFEHDRVTRKRIEFDSYERMGAELKNVTTVSVLNKEDNRVKVKKEPKTCGAPKSNPEFYDFFLKLKNMPGFDDEKLVEAKTAISLECFTAKQVKVTMTGFEKESTKLAFAKFAYDYVYDRSAYSVVSSSLSKEAHRDELNAYVREH
jgi:hypothetical protein